MTIRLVSTSITTLPISSGKRNNKEHMERKCSENMSLTGGCNDYMFSGHTSFITLCILFIMYAQGKINIMAIIYGIISFVCIIGTHNHYSVDVFIGWIITMLVFQSHKTCFTPMV